MRFSSDEAVAARLATNEVQFFDPADFSKGIAHRLRVPGIAAFELSKAPGLYVAVFVPESKVFVLQLWHHDCTSDVDIIQLFVFSYIFWISSHHFCQVSHVLFR